jgi:hypothetical protein
MVSQRVLVGAALGGPDARAVTLHEAEERHREVEDSEEEVADEGHVREAVKGRPPRRPPRHADGGAGKDRAMDPLAIAGRRHGNDRSAPVLSGDRDVVEIEGLDQR